MAKDNKCSERHNKKIAWSLVAMMLAAAVVLCLLVDRAKIAREFDDLRLRHLISIHEQAYDIDRLEFCLKHGVTSCDDESLTAWNEAHPDQKFAIKDLQDFTESAHQELETYKMK